MNIDDLQAAYLASPGRMRRAAAGGENDNQFDLIALYAQRVRDLRKGWAAPDGAVPIIYGAAPLEVSS